MNYQGQNFNFFLLTSFLLVIVVFFYSFNNFFIKKNYKVVVETPCDSGESCFIRDCVNGDCPPNEFEQYRIFLINGSNFETCSNDSCVSVCLAGEQICEEVFCDESLGDACFRNNVQPLIYSDLENTE